LTAEEYTFMAAQRREGEGSWTRIAEAMGTNRSDNDLKNKYYSMTRKQFSEEELRGEAAVLIAYIKEVQAAEASAPGAASARQARSRQRAASVDSRNGSAGESPSSSPQQPRVDRPRRPPKPLRPFAGEQAAVVGEVSAGAEAMPQQAFGLEQLAWPEGLYEPLMVLDPFDAAMATKDFGQVNDAAEDELLYNLLWAQQ
jgi:hypothetical protein